MKFFLLKLTFFPMSCNNTNVEYFVKQSKTEIFRESNNFQQHKPNQSKSKFFAWPNLSWKIRKQKIPWNHYLNKFSTDLFREIIFKSEKLTLVTFANHIKSSHELENDKILTQKLLKLTFLGLKLVWPRLELELMEKIQMNVLSLCANIIFNAFAVHSV